MKLIENFQPKIVEAGLVHRPHSIQLPQFKYLLLSSDPDEAEEQYCVSLDQWRKSVGLDRFHILGHSFGGYLTAAFALRHPDTVKHVILADPWGMAVRPDELAQRFELN